MGSASPDLICGVSESLAGRVGFIDLSGFNLAEVGWEHTSRLWVRGGLPRSFLAEDDSASSAWRQGFIRIFLERDIARRYLDILVGAFMVRALPQWLENLAKRQIKSQKVYLQDPGIHHALLGLEDLSDIRGNPKLGASWEGFALEQVVSLLETREAYFWGAHAGAELDLLLPIRGKRCGLELKYADAPGRSRSMLTALEDLSLHHIWVVYPGSDEYAVHERITVVPPRALPKLARTLNT